MENIGRGSKGRAAQLMDVTAWHPSSWSVLRVEPEPPHPAPLVAYELGDTRLAEHWDPGMAGGLAEQA